jgi:glycerophosphoryl diester phosphodiesterase
MRIPERFSSGGTIGIAHRGSRLLWPENTELAFSGARSLGYRVFETDLRVTADGVLVCFHDPVLNRTTNGWGLLASTTFEEMRRLDAGYRHRADGGFPFRGNGVVVPAFRDMITLFPEAAWVVDLKADGVARPLAALIDELDLHERVIVGSFSTERIAEFRAMTGGKVATSTPPGETMRAVLSAASIRNGDPFHPFTAALQVPSTWYGMPVVTPRLVDLAHSYGRSVHVWTVNDPEEMADLTVMGVDGLITDRPDLLAAG